MGFGKYYFSKQVELASLWSINVMKKQQYSVKLPVSTERDPYFCSSRLSFLRLMIVGRHQRDRRGANSSSSAHPIPKDRLYMAFCNSLERRSPPSPWDLEHNLPFKLLGGADGELWWDYSVRVNNGPSRRREQEDGEMGEAEDLFGGAVDDGIC